MDLETENRIASILLKEAAELRRRAEEDGVLSYLHKPVVRGRPNFRFLTATVIGVQQANRAVEENEMWRSRQKELALDSRRRDRSWEEGNTGKKREDHIDPESYRRKRNADSRSGSSYSCSLEKKDSDDGYQREDEGLRDEELEEFLHSRIKRGRGDVGSRMDETGPYLPTCADPTEKQSTYDVERWKSSGNRVFLGPEKPASLRSDDTTSEDESLSDKKMKSKKVGSSKQHKDKHKTKGKSKEKKKKRREEKKHRHR